MQDCQGGSQLNPSAPIYPPESVSNASERTDVPVFPMETAGGLALLPVMRPSHQGRGSHRDLQDPLEGFFTILSVLSERDYEENELLRVFEGGFYHERRGCPVWLCE